MSIKTVCLYALGAAAIAFAGDHTPELAPMPRLAPQSSIHDFLAPDLHPAQCGYQDEGRAHEIPLRGFKTLLLTLANECTSGKNAPDSVQLTDCLNDRAAFSKHIEKGKQRVRDYRAERLAQATAALNRLGHRFALEGTVKPVVDETLLEWMKKSPLKEITAPQRPEYEAEEKKVKELFDKYLKSEEAVAKAKEAKDPKLSELQLERQDALLAYALALQEFQPKERLMTGRGLGSSPDSYLALCKTKEQREALAKLRASDPNLMKLAGFLYPEEKEETPEEEICRIFKGESCAEDELRGDTVAYLAAGWGAQYAVKHAAEIEKLRAKGDLSGLADVRPFGFDELTPFEPNLTIDNKPRPQNLTREQILDIVMPLQDQRDALREWDRMLAIRDLFDREREQHGLRFYVLARKNRRGEIMDLETSLVKGKPTDPKSPLILGQVLSDDEIPTKSQEAFAPFFNGDRPKHLGQLFCPKPPFKE